MITVSAPAGIPEVGPGADLAALIVDACAADPLRDGDIVVVTSKILSKAEGRFAPAVRRDALVLTEARRTVAVRGRTRIVATQHGLVLAGAGIDNSNVDPAYVLMLPVDPDASAASLRRALAERFGVRVAVIVSDTAGRPWREGQVDQAIGAAGVRVAEDFAGRTDGYGNDLMVTKTAYADEIAAAADLVKTKLGGRPVAVLRGLGHLVGDGPDAARDLVRPPALDLFAYGSREAVLAAVLSALGSADRYEELVGLSPDEGADRVLAGHDLGPEAAALVRRVLSADLTMPGADSKPL